MKWFLRKITAIAILNFILLSVTVAFLHVQKPENKSQVNFVSGVLGSRDVFLKLKNHNAKDDCWIGYKEQIYNITSVFGTHPGGDAVMLKYCGIDATVAFDTKDLSPAAAHSANALSLLSQYLVQ